MYICTIKQTNTKKMTNAMTTKRIGEGTYAGTYKGQDVQIAKVYMAHSNETLWYSLINGEGGDDLVSTKKFAIYCAIEMIDNASTYGIELK